MHHSLFLDRGGSNLTFCLLFRHGENGSNDTLSPPFPPTLQIHAFNPQTFCVYTNSWKTIIFGVKVTQKNDTYLNALPFSKYRPHFTCQLSQNLIQLKKKGYTIICLLMHFMKRGYYSLKCCYEGNHDVSFEHEGFNMCKGKGMHWFHMLLLVLFIQPLSVDIINLNKNCQHFDFKNKPSLWSPIYIAAG